MPSVRRIFPCAALTCWAVLSAASTGAQPSEPPIQQVLVLQSFDRGNMTLDYFTGNFRVELDQHAGRPVNVVQIVVGPTGLVGASEDAILAYKIGRASCRERVWIWVDAGAGKEK